MNYREIWRVRTVADRLANPPKRDGILVGDGEICKGSTTLLAGPGGVGKSMIIQDLAESGVTQEPWFDRQIQRPYRTMILQVENGETRVFDHLKAMKTKAVEEVSISEVPKVYIDLSDPDLLDYVGELLEEHRPDIVIVDPLREFARNESLEAIKEAIRWFRLAVGTGDESPALVLCHHTNKSVGTAVVDRAELNKISGSSLVVSTCRCAYLVTHATGNANEDRVVFANLKNNNGAEAPASVWHRSLEGFTKSDTSISELSRPTLEQSEDAVSYSVFEALEDSQVARKDLVAFVMKSTGFGRSKVQASIKRLLDEGDILESKRGGKSSISLAATQDCVRPKPKPKKPEADGQIDLF